MSGTARFTHERIHGVFSYLPNRIDIRKWAVLLPPSYARQPHSYHMDTPVGTNQWGVDSDMVAPLLPLERLYPL